MLELWSSAYVIENRKGRVTRAQMVRIEGRWGRAPEDLRDGRCIAIAGSVEHAPSGGQPS